ncbi:MAG: HAD family hydrolase [Candidatus Dormibacteria bacterium]
MPAASSAPRQLRGAIFDFGGVITQPIFRLQGDEDPVLLSLVGHFIREAEAVYGDTTVHHDLHLLEVGRLSEADFFARLCARFEADGGPHVDPFEARQMIFGRPLVACAEMVDAVARVRAAGYRTAMLTNVARDSAHLWEALINVEELFDVLVDSSVVGLRKPDPAIFRLTCERLGLAPEDCLFVDDIPSNVAGAAELGIETILCRDPAEVAAQVLHRLLGAAVGLEGAPPD